MRPTTFIGLAFSCVAFTASAQTTSPPARPLNLRECIAQALEHNLDLQIDRYDPEIARLRLGGAYGVYDPTFSLNAGRNVLNQPPQFDPKKPGTDAHYELTTDSVGSGVTGYLPSGLNYNLSASSSRLSAHTFFDPVFNFSSFTSYPPDGLRGTNAYAATAGITLRQPLLKNLWTDANRQTIQVSKKIVQISEEVLRGQIMRTVSIVEAAYYDLIFTSEQVKVQQKALDLAKEFLTETQKKVQAGAVPPLDAKQAESQMETTQSDLEAANQAYYDQQNVLKRLLTEDFREWADVPVLPTESLAVVPEHFKRNESWDTAMKERPDLREMRLTLEKLGILTRFNRNQLLPAIDAVGGYGWQSFDHGLSGSLGSLRDGTYPVYSGGVVITFPFSNRTARDNYRAGQAAEKQALLRLKKLEQDILAQVDSAARLVDTTYRQVGSTHNARVFAEAALEAEQSKFQFGTTTSFVVLEFQRKLTAARAAEIRALLDYNKARAQLALSEGSTLQRNQITLKIK